MQLAPTPNIGDMIVDEIRKELRRFATVGKLIEPPGEGTSIDPFGVQVLYSNEAPIILFRGVTHDDIEWMVQVDARAYSREYHESIVPMVNDNICNKRRERQGKGPIILLDEEFDVESVGDPDKHPAELAPEAAEGAIIH